MAYNLKKITIRTNNTMEGMGKIQEVWSDLMNRKYPMLSDTEQKVQAGLSFVSVYSNYESNETGDYDFSILAADKEFFASLDAEVKNGTYQLFEVCDPTGNIAACTQKAWEEVWNQQASKEIRRSFTKDYEYSILPQYSKDQKAHCLLYIAVKC